MTVVEPERTAETAGILERYRRHRLEPARVAPPTLTSRTVTIEGPLLEGTITLVLAEEADWNTWDDGSARLFNNRVGHLFELDLRPVGHARPLRWEPATTRLEMNVAGDPLYAATNQEALLEELIFWAFQQERAVVPGDLVDRARAAGELRRVYLSREVEASLQGLVAFPYAPPQEGEADPSDDHVVSMRLTVGLYLDGALREVSALFD